MYSSRIIQTVLIPAAAVVASTEEKCKKKGRPSELPIYQAEPAPLPKEPESGIPGVIEETFATARVHVTKIFKEVSAYKRVASDYIDQGKGNAEWLLKYLRKEDDFTPKAGAIGIGALTGFIFGLRGGIIKRTIYASTGALGMASICYPKEAAEYSHLGITETKKYATIAYNFAYGVKKDDPPLELPSFPHIPSLSEAWNSVMKSTSLVSEPQKVEKTEK